jgi:transglutaminase-like putative cysteine protease
MYKRIFCSSILLSLCIIAFSKELMYPVSEIPAALLQNAHTVMRVYKQEVEIKSEKSAVVSVTEVRTILNKNGEDDAYFSETYDPMNKISNVKGKVYNELGKQIKSLGGDDVVDHSAISGFSLYEDNRVKYIDPKNLTYPFTVEYTYDIDLKHTFFLPVWSHGSGNTSYENSVFIVKTPLGYSFRYKEYNLPKGVVKTIQDNKDVYTWTITNLSARIDEPMTIKSLPTYPLVRLAPNRFEVGETKGSSETWKDLGIWMTGLLDKKDILSESTKAKLKEITSSCKNDLEKVKVIYQYMQQKTRYVSIQVGIGGWQPFDAETVDKTSYGDCKALSNYTKALLWAVGVKSYYALVYAGASSRNIDADFASNQFNHAIVFVPIDKDTVWLECTSQRMPCGFNGDFTDDRDVLIVDGENSKLVHTRIYPANENCINRNTKVDLVDIESGIANTSTKYIGLCYDAMMSTYYADDADKLKKITQSIELPSFSLTKFSLVENRSKTPSLDEHLDLTFTNYIKKMGDVALLPLNFMNRLSSIPDKVRNRQTDMCIRRSYMENDTVTYQLPKGYQVTDLPQKTEFVGKFGKYISQSTQKGGEITYIRHFELTKGTFPAQDYTDFRDFLEQIATADGVVASLKKI